MKITVLCSDLGVRIPGTKGASLHLASISSALAAAGHEVQLVGVAGHGAPPAEVVSVLLAHPGRSEGEARARAKLAFTDRLLTVVSAAVDAFEPDLVYERLALFGTAGMRLAAASGVPHVVEINALLVQEEAQWRGLHLADDAQARESAVLDRAELRVAVSDELAAAVAQVAQGPTVVVPNGVELALFSQPRNRGEARRALGLPQHAHIACFTGSLRPWHGLDIALRSLALAPSTRLLIAGDGDVRPQLEALAAELGIVDRVTWLGQVPHGDVATVLAASDVALAPYPPLAHFPFSPLKLYEYLAAGVPVIASDVGQVRSVLGDGRFGSLVPAGDVGALARALTPRVGALRDAERGRAYALEHHGWNRRAEQLGVLFAEVTHAVAR